MKIKNEKLKAFRFKRFARKSYAVFNSLGKRVTIGVLTSSMLISIPVAKVFANEEMQPSGERSYTLEEVEVTASRVPVELAEAARIVSVVSKIEIDATPAKSIQELLEHLVSLDVRQRGKQGVQADISIRGGTHDQTAVFLNGILFSNPQTGHYNFDIPVNLSDIQRIEIIEGPATKVYGSGAFTGAINIITYSDAENKVSLQLGGGMHKLFTSEAAVSLQSGDFSHRLSGSFNSSGGYVPNSDYKTGAVFFQSVYKASDVDFFFQSGYNNKSYGANTFYSAAYPDQHDHTQRIFASVQGKTKGRVQFTPQLFWNRHYDHYQLIKNTSTGENYHQSDVFGGKFDANFSWKFGKTAFGGEVTHEGILSTVLGEALKEPIRVSGKKDVFYLKSADRTNINYFLEHNFAWKNWLASAGVLANYNSSLHEGFRFYPGVDFSYLISPSVKLYASYNTAFRMPTFTDLYYEGKTNKGNPDLKPETSTAYEFGIKFNRKFMNVHAAGYYRKGRNMIDWVKENSEDIWESRNLTKLDTYGFETNLTFSFRKLWGDAFFIDNLHVGYAYINQQKDADNYISNYAMEYLKHKFTARLRHAVWKNISCQWNFRWQDRVGGYTKYEDLKPAYEVSYAPYAVLDVKLSWLQKNWTVFAEATNIFDASYYDIGNIPQPGCWISGGVKYVLYASE